MSSRSSSVKRRPTKRTSKRTKTPSSRKASITPTPVTAVTPASPDSPPTPSPCGTPSPAGSTPTTPASPSAADTPSAGSPPTAREKRKKRKAPPLKRALRATARARALSAQPTPKKDLSKSEKRQLSKSKKRAEDDANNINKVPVYERKQTEDCWAEDTKHSVEQLMKRYSKMGPKSIRAEFQKEVGAYRNQNTAHTWFDAFPDRNWSQEPATCLDYNRVLVGGSAPYVNASWAEIKDHPENSPNLLHSLQKKYILTQVPLEHTLEEFWELIHEHKASRIVILIPAQNPDQPFKQFWPRYRDNVQVHGSITVTSLEHVHFNEVFQEVHVLEVERQGFGAVIVWLCLCETPALDRPYSSPVETIRHLVKLTSLIDYMDQKIHEEEGFPSGATGRAVVLMDEYGGTTRASLLLLVDAVCTLVPEMGSKQLQIAEVFKWAKDCRGGAQLGEDEYLIAVQSIAEYIWCATHTLKHDPCPCPDKEKKDASKHWKKLRKIREKYHFKYEKAYKKIVGVMPEEKFENYNGYDY